MPILSTERKSKRIILEASSQPNDEAWVDVYDKVLADDIMGLEGFEEKKQEATYETLSRIITDWNFTLPSGEKAPINREHIKMLPFEDIMQIMTEVRAFARFMELADAKKKPYSSSLVPSKPAKQAQK